LFWYNVFAFALYNHFIFYYLITHTKKQKIKHHPPPIPEKPQQPVIIPSRTQQIPQMPPLFILKVDLTMPPRNDKV